MNRRLMLLVTWLVFASPSFVLGANRYWSVSTGNWSVSGNWTPTGVPGYYDNACIDNGGTATVDCNASIQHLHVGRYNAASTSQVAHPGNWQLVVDENLHVGWAAGAEGEYEIGDGSLIVRGEAWIGGHDGVPCAGAAGAIVNDGGYNEIQGQMNLGAGLGDAAGDGTYALTSQDSRVVAKERVYLGHALGGSGLLRIDHGEATLEDCLWVGYDGDGQLVVDHSSTLEVLRDLCIANCLGEGSFEIKSEGATITVGRDFILGEWGAVFTISDQDGATITMSGVDSNVVIAEDVSAADVSGLGLLTLVFQAEDEEAATKGLEAAGVAVAGVEGVPASSEDFDADNFVLKELVVGKEGAGDTYGPVMLEPVDDEDNQDDGEDDEAVYVETLTITAGGTFAYDEDALVTRPIYYLNSGDPKKLFGGDADLDGDVDLDDLGVLAGNYGETEGMVWGDGDFDGDRDVDLDDLGILAGNYERGTGGEEGGGLPPLEDVDDDGDFDIDDVLIILEAAEDDD